VPQVFGSVEIDDSKAGAKQRPQCLGRVVPVQRLNREPVTEVVRGQVPVEAIDEQLSLAGLVEVIHIFDAMPGRGLVEQEANLVARVAVPASQLVGGRALAALRHPAQRNDARL
jgi:hypothetical protein